MSRETVIADASCLIVLENIQELRLLHELFGEISITAEVGKEFSVDLPEWIKIKQAQNTHQQNALSLILDAGEASSIALCLETENSLLVIDEKKGRRVAQQLNLKIVGTPGVVLLAKEKGLINSVGDLLTKLETADFRISQSLRAKILEND